ncbi:MAG: Ig-like domain-containing protein [Lachnospiraceae bacterium]|nr:Ig-like domain-containing protein [Lachnospiraceae bacterium]
MNKMKEKMKEKMTKGLTKRILSLVLTLVMLFALLPMNSMVVKSSTNPDEGDEIIYIPLFSQGNVVSYNVTKGTSSTLKVGNLPNSSTLDADGMLYVTNRDSHTVSVIDTSDFSLKETIQLNQEVFGLTLDPSMENIYISCRDGIVIYNLENKTKETIFSSYWTYYSCVTNDYVYAVVYNSETILKYDLKTGTEQSFEILNGRKYLGNISPDGKSMVVATEIYSSQTDIIDLETMTVSGSISLQTKYADYSSDGKYIYALDTGSTLKIYDSSTYELVSELNLGTRENYTLGVRSDGNIMYVLSYSNSCLDVINISDINNISLEEKITLSGQPYIAGTFMPSAYLQKRIDEINTKPQHTFIYSASGNKIEVWCEDTDCPSGITSANKVELALTATSSTYSGSAYTGVAFEDTTAWTELELEIPTIKYIGRGSTTYAESETAPTTVGTYTAKVTVEGNTASVDFEIEKLNGPAAPTVTGVVPTVKGGTDGKVTGVDDTMEYSEDGGNTWKSVTGNEITGLKAGDYKVRVKETDTTKASEIATVTVPEGQPATTTVPEGQPATTTVPEGQPAATTVPEGQPATTTDPKEKKDDLSINVGLKSFQTGSKIKVKWSKVADADCYEVYAAYCGERFGKAVKTIDNNNTTSVSITKLNGKKINLKKNYKLYVKACKTVDGKKQTLTKTITCHVVGRKNAKYTNVKKITLSKSSLTINAGKTAKIKAKSVLVDKKKKQLSDKHAKEFRYASTDKNIAKVSQTGVVTGVKAGTCKIYVYSRNGYTKAVKITVK